jgi:hypothetical protein
MIVPAVGVAAEKERILPEDRWGKCGDAGNPGVYSGIIPGSINLHALVRAHFVLRIVYSVSLSSSSSCATTLEHNLMVLYHAS